MITLNSHNLCLKYIDVPQGPIVYIMRFVDTDKYYIGSTNNGGDRIQGHFTHELTSERNINYIYQEGLYNNVVEIHALQVCNSKSETKYKEKLLIKLFKTKIGSKLLNKVV